MIAVVRGDPWIVVFLFVGTLGNGAYQLAVLSLIGTMGIGLWLVWPLSDRWRGREVERAARHDAPELVAEPLSTMAAG